MKNIDYNKTFLTKLFQIQVGVMVLMESQATILSKTNGTSFLEEKESLLKRAKELSLQFDAEMKAVL